MVRASLVQARGLQRASVGVSIGCHPSKLPMVPAEEQSPIPTVKARLNGEVDQHGLPVFIPKLGLGYTDAVAEQTAEAPAEAP
jgi:hypothetical protein